MMTDEFDDYAEAVAALDDALASDAAPEGCMQLSELDGFLTGLAVGPQEVPPQEWLAWVWGDGFSDEALRERVGGMIVAHFARIAADLDDGFGVDPLFWEEDGAVDAGEWADGFMAAVDIRPEAWMPILEDSEARMLMVPILALACDAEGNPLLRLEAKDMERIASEAETLIPNSVEEIRSFWTARRG